MFTVNNVSYFRNNRQVFKNVGFSAGLGSCLLLVGGNGIGKTSLLRIIAGLAKPTSGELLWNGQNIQGLRSDFNSDMCYLGHKNFAKSELTVLENLQFFAGVSNSEILIPSAIRYFGLEEVVNKKMDKLSMGWQKRVLLSKLLCCPATFWLLDEPSNNLDKQGKELLFNLINVRVKEGGIVIAATHDEILFNLGSKFCLEDFA